MRSFFPAFALLLAPMPALLAATRSSADYTVSVESIDAAGMRAASSDYINDGEMASFVGQAEVASYRVITGYAAQLPNAPVPGPDTLSRSPNLSAKVKLASLLANDTDPDGGLLTLVTLDSLSANGAGVFDETPWVLYEPVDGFNASDAFSYVIRNPDGETAVATVTSLVVPAGSEPTHNNVALLPQGGDLLVRFVGVPGVTYVIEWKAALDDPSWNNLSTTAAAASGLFEALDTSGQTRFYRAISQ